MPELDRASPLFLSVDRLRLGLSGVALDRPVCSPGRLGRELLASALADLLLSSPALLGSLALLGNPTHLVRSLAAGVSELVTQPWRALAGGGGGGTEDGGARDPRGDAPLVLGVLAGLARGAKGFASHVGEGTLTSVSGLALSLARNLDRLGGQAGTEAGGAGGGSGGDSASANDAHTAALPRAWTSSQELNDDSGEAEDGDEEGEDEAGALAAASGIRPGGRAVLPSLAGLVVRPLSSVLDLVGRGSAGLAAALSTTHAVQHVAPARLLRARDARALEEPVQ